ncbi:MAG: GAF domain-containing sensor histidine kinase, partial [Candidatus Margulisiibacteriota bacterium]
KKFLEEGVKQNAVVPMKARGRVIGMLAVDNLLSKKPIDKEGLHLLMTFAGQAATAVSNARMMGEERAHGVKIKKIEELRRDFLSRMSHEVRTPLASIKESLSLILEGITGPVSAGQTKFLLIAEQNLARVVKLIDELFEMVKSEFNKVSMEIALVSPVSIVDDVIYEISPQAQKKGISVENGVSGLLAHVHADKAKIHTVISNLIRNAIRYTPENGHINISSSENEEEVGIEVKDDGIGIEMDDREKIFEKYYKVDSKVHDLESGAGLGLAIAKEIVEAHGGRIMVESRGLGRGSNFIFTLPKG